MVIRALFWGGGWLGRAIICFKNELIGHVVITLIGEAQMNKLMV